MILDVLLYHALGAVLPIRADEVAVSPELPTPQLLLDFGAGAKNLSRRDALDDLHDPLRAVRRHGLQQKMHVVALRADLKERDLVALADFQARLFELLIHRLAEDHPPVLRWTDDVVHQHRDVVALTDVLAHARSLALPAAGHWPHKSKVFINALEFIRKGFARRDREVFRQAYSFPVFL